MSRALKVVLLASFAFFCISPAPVKTAPTATKIVDNGGSVDWYKGPAAHDRIAFEAVVDEVTRNTEIYTINPDGTDQQCVTCASIVPKGFLGNATWHPDGEHLLFQVENDNSSHTAFNNHYWGFDNDLWIIKTDGTEAARVYQTPAGFSALYPHFNAAGNKIAWSQRVPGAAPQNPFDRWRIITANFDITQPAAQMISGLGAIIPSGSGIYEVNELLANNKITYSHTNAGAPYIDDIYIANMDGTGAVNMINRPDTWDEFGFFSPASRFVFAFMSNRFSPSTVGSTLRTELYVRVGAGVHRVTFFNPTPTSDRVIVSKIDWDRNGQRIAMQVFRPNGLINENWILAF